MSMGPMSRLKLPWRKFDALTTDIRLHTAAAPSTR